MNTLCKIDCLIAVQSFSSASCFCGSIITQAGKSNPNKQQCNGHGHITQLLSVTVKVEEMNNVSWSTIIVELVLTSLPMIAIEGAVRSQFTSPNTGTSRGLVHSNTNVAATISCIPSSYKFKLAEFSK